jgi:hypothetical protein
MSQASDKHQEMRAEYDIKGGVRGKYFQRYSGNASVVAVWFSGGMTMNRTDAIFTSSVIVGTVQLGSTPQRQTADAA